MNTIRSTWVGWGVLTVAGAGSYYFAKQSINADKKARFEQDQRNKRRAAILEEEERIARSSNSSSSVPLRKGKHKEPEHTHGSCKGTRDEDAAKSHKIAMPNSTPKSKYAPSETFRSKKGDRFS